MLNNNVYVLHFAKGRQQLLTLNNGAISILNTAKTMMLNVFALARIQTCRYTKIHMRTNMLQLQRSILTGTSTSYGSGVELVDLAA